MVLTYCVCRRWASGQTFEVVQHRGFFLDCIDITSKCIRFVAYIINDISFKEGEFKEFISGELRFDVNKTRIYFRTNSLHTNTLFISFHLCDIWPRVLVWEDWWNLFWLRSVRYIGMSIDFDLLLALTRSDDGRLYMNASMIYREQMKIGSIGLISKLWQMRSLWHIFSPSYFLCTGENIISRKGIFVISRIGHFKSIGQAVDIIFHSDWSEMSFFSPSF